MLRIALLLLFALSLQAQEPKKDPKPEASPTLADYENALNKYKKATKEAFDFATWKEVELTNKKTKEKITFEKLSTLEKHVFCVSVGNRLMTEMGLLSGFWNAEADKFKDPNHKLIPLEKVEKPEQKAAELKDVEKYQKQLQELRQSFATNFETYLTKFFKAFKDDIPEKEREFYLKQIREYHDKEKLIERKN
jgi:hypothetical protein